MQSFDNQPDFDFKRDPLYPAVPTKALAATVERLMAEAFA